jgi:hypothetical protein
MPQAFQHYVPEDLEERTRTEEKTITMALWKKPSLFGYRSIKDKGLRRVPSNLIGEANERTAAQVMRIGSVFVGTSAFCLLSLLGKDTALVAGNVETQSRHHSPRSVAAQELLFVAGPLRLIASHHRQQEEGMAAL